MLDYQLKVRVAFVFCCIAAVSFGQSRENLDAITDGRGMQITGVALRGRDFSGVDFSNATFDGATLEHVSFDECSFAGASFRNANLKGMCIRNSCDLSNANFDDALINGTVRILSSSNPQVGELQLSNSQLKSTLSYKEKDLSFCSITGDSNALPKLNLDLRDFNLRDAIFEGSNFGHFQFDNAKIEGSVFRNGFINKQQLESTKSFQQNSLRGVEFWKKNLIGRVDYGGCDLHGARLDAAVSLTLDSWPTAEHRVGFEDAKIEGSFLVGMNFAQLAQTRDYKSGIILNVHFGRADFSNADLSGVNFTGCKFTMCDFTGANLNDAVLSQVSFQDKTRALTPQQIKQTWTYRHGRMGNVKFRKL